MTKAGDVVLHGVPLFEAMSIRPGLHMRKTRESEREEMSF